MTWDTAICPSGCPLDVKGESLRSVHPVLALGYYYSGTPSQCCSSATSHRRVSIEKEAEVQRQQRMLSEEGHKGETGAVRQGETKARHSRTHVRAGSSDQLLPVLFPLDSKILLKSQSCPCGTVALTRPIPLCSRSHKGNKTLLGPKNKRPMLHGDPSPHLPLTCGRLVN